MDDWDEWLGTPLKNSKICKTDWDIWAVCIFWTGKPPFPSHFRLNHETRNLHIDWRLTHYVHTYSIMYIIIISMRRKHFAQIVLRVQKCRDHSRYKLGKTHTSTLARDSHWTQINDIKTNIEFIFINRKSTQMLLYVCINMLSALEKCAFSTN